MGNVLLHLEEGERLDINCTQLLSNEVRSDKIYVHDELGVTIICVCRFSKDTNGERLLFTLRACGGVTR